MNNQFIVALQVKRTTRLHWMSVGALALWLCVCQAGGAAIIVVNESCTLADAIQAANTDAPSGDCGAGDGVDEIRLTHDVLLTGAFGNPDGFGATGLPEISSEMSIEGAGFKIERESGAEPFRLLYVDGGGDLTMRNTTVTNGVAISEIYPELGGGGILSFGTVALEGCTVSLNTAVGEKGTGGGISSWRDLVLVNTTLSTNVAESGGGGLYNVGDVLVVDSQILQNSAFSGGGIENRVVSGFELVGTTISENHAVRDGGGINSAGVLLRSVITNSTLSGNTTDGSWGSAIDHSPSSGYGEPFPLEITHSTVVSPSGASAVAAGGDVVFESTVLNCGADCCGPDYFDDFYVDGGGNLSTDDTCFSTIVPTGLDPELADNGGPTPTHALFSESSAIDVAGDCGLATDQRGFVRRDGACDAGAYEFGASTGPALMIAGACPGEISIAIAGTSASGDVAIAIASAPGVSEIPPSQPCAGTVLDLDRPSLFGVVPADESGVYTAERTLEAGACGRFVQVIDLNTCVSSNVATTPSDNRERP